MTTADPRDRQLAMIAAFGHTMPALGLATLVLAVPSWLSVGALTPVSSPLCLIVCVIMFLSLIHTAIPDSDCTRCDRARGHNPRVLAERHRWALWFDHQLNRNSSVTWGALIVAVVVTNVAVHITGVTLLYIPLDVGFVSMCASAWRHFLLGPWCAYCRDDGGWGDGDHERIPDPEPVGRGIR